MISNDELKQKIAVLKTAAMKHVRADSEGHPAGQEFVPVVEAAFDVGEALLIALNTIALNSTK